MFIMMRDFERNKYTQRTSMYAAPTAIHLATRSFRCHNNSKLNCEFGAKSNTLSDVYIMQATARAEETLKAGTRV